MGAEITTMTLDIDAALRDGYEVHCAALERGMDITLLARQVLMVGSGNPIIGDASFVHGVPQGSSVAGVTYAQDKRVRRALLERGGFTVPRGATFSIGRSARGAVAFAERIGYPVVVKPTMGDNAIGVIPSIRNSEQLEDAIEYLHTPFEDREDFTRASYAMTELREPGLRDGVRVAPPSYRFLVEREVPGQYIRLFIIDGKVRNAMYCPDGPWNAQKSGLQDVTSQIHPTLADYAASAARVVPGLFIAAVDVVVPDFRASTARKNIHIVEYSERPWLGLQAGHNIELARDLAAQILHSELRSKPTLEARDSVAVSVKIDGAVAPESFKEAFGAKSSELGLESSLVVTDPALGHITGQLSGGVREIVWLVETALDEGVDGHRAMLAEVRME